MEKRKKYEVKNVPLEKIEGGNNLRQRVLEVSNGDSMFVKAPKLREGSKLYNILHAKTENRDTAHELTSFIPVRAEVCEALGIQMDADHMIILGDDDAHGPDTFPDGTVRDFRAFITFINTNTGEGFYGEGRTYHNILLKKIAGLALSKKESALNPEIFRSLLGEGWITIKGFISDDNFAELPNEFRDNIAMSIETAEGEIIRTPASWFISGSSLSTVE